MSYVSAKLVTHFRLEDMKKALKERGIVVNHANINKMLKVIKKGEFTANKELIDRQPIDRETLLLYGFTFEKDR